MLYSQHMNIINKAHAKIDTFSTNARFGVLLALVIPAATANGVAHLTKEPAILFASLGYLCLILASRLYYLGTKNG